MPPSNLRSDSTLVFAATDTTSGALTQILQLLAQNPEVQDKLREEISAATENGEIPYDDIVSLPFLDAVCRETLRLSVSPLPNCLRYSYLCAIATHLSARYSDSQFYLICASSH